MVLVGYIDSNKTRDKEERNMTFGYAYFISFSPIGWSMNKNSMISPSLIMTNYMGIVNVGK